MTLPGTTQVALPDPASSGRNFLGLALVPGVAAFTILVATWPACAPIFPTAGDCTGVEPGGNSGGDSAPISRPVEVDRMRKETETARGREVQPHIFHLVVDAIRLVESGGANVPGDGGRAVGEWQLHAGACRDAARLADGRWELGDRWVPERAREIATAYTLWLRNELAERLRRDPNAAELYAAYNLGLRGFCRRGLRLERCPRITRTRAAAVGAMVAAEIERREDAEFQRRFDELVAAGRKLTTDGHGCARMEATR